ncbi:MAG: putative amidoligase domain-containing protein [Solirubrobacterales bacterium]
MSFRLWYANNQSQDVLKKALSDQFGKLTVTETLIAGIPHAMIASAEQNEETLDFNSPEAIANAETRSFCRRILQMNHLPVIEKETTLCPLREYSVFVANLQPFKISRKEARGGNASEWTAVHYNENDKEVKRVFQGARNAIQSLGLDFGAVHLSINREKGQVVVLDIDSAPTMTVKTAKELAQVIHKLAETPYSQKSLMLGADPEFLLAYKDTNKLAAASHFFPRTGTIGCDNIRLPNRQDRPIAEVRPTPNECPMELTRTIQQNLKEANKTAPFKNLKMVAGSQPIATHAIGGHIHFGGVQASSKLLRALDNYLAIPVLMLENPVSATKRRQRYGLLSDFRTKEHGFEYRTLPSWLISPAYAQGILCAAKLIALNYTRLRLNIFLSAAAQESFYTAQKMYFKQHVAEVWDTLMALPEAENYTVPLTAMKEASQAMTAWDELSDIRVAWHLGAPKKIYRATTGPKKPAATRVTVRVR